MNIKKAIGSDGKILYYALYSFARGRKLLVKEGWHNCFNPKFYSRTTDIAVEYAHYNNITKSWIFDGGRFEMQRELQPEGI
jgi:hypothetical protein